MKFIINESLKINPFLDILPMGNDLMYNLRYDYDSPYSLELMWNKANHLVTTAKQIRTKQFNNLFLTEEDYDLQIDYLYSKVPYLLLYSTGVILNLYEMLIEKISDESKQYNKILIMMKWLSIINPTEGRIYVESILEEGPFPVYCETCANLIEFNEKYIEQFQFNWFIECHQCNQPISLAEYYFFDMSDLEG